MQALYYARHDVTYRMHGVNARAAQIDLTCSARRVIREGAFIDREFTGLRQV